MLNPFYPQFYIFFNSIWSKNINQYLLYLLEEIGDDEIILGFLPSLLNVINDPSRYIRRNF